MVEDTDELDGLFHALSNRARRQMLARLSRGDLTVGELAEPLTMTLAAASKHIKVLERANLVRQSVDGRRHLCRLDPASLVPASAWLSFYQRHWEGRLDALESLFGTETTTSTEVDR